MTNAVRDNLDSLRKLPHGWNSYNAAPITEAAITSAERLIDMLRTSLPAIVPRSCGGIQIEWHEQGMNVEIEIDADGTVQPFE